MAVAILMALLSSAVWGTSDFIGGVVSRRLPAYLVVVTSQAVGLAGVTIAALALGSFGDDRGWVWPALVGGSTLAVGLVAFYTALAIGPMGIVSPLASMGVLVPVAFGLVRGDSPTVVTSVGVLVALGGAVAASGPELRGGASPRPVLLAGLSAVLFGVSMVLLAQGAKSSPVMSLWGMRVVSVVGLSVGMLFLGGVGSGTTERWRRNAPLIVIAGLMDAGANLLFSVASLHGYISVVSVLASLYPVMTVLLARVLLHQRLLPPQFYGIIAVLAGVALVSLS